MSSPIEPVSSVNTDPYAAYQSQGFTTSQDNFSRMSVGGSQNGNSGTEAIKEVISESDPDSTPNIIV